MTFADQWANRHDEACEERHVAPLFPDTTNLCFCYRRWLEGRLEAVKAAGQKFADADQVDEDGNVTPAYNTAYREWYGVLATLLPPKGTGDE